MAFSGTQKDDICHNTHVLKWTLLISIVLPFLCGWAKNDLDMLHVFVDMIFFKAETTLHFQKYPDMCGQGQRLL